MLQCSFPVTTVRKHYPLSGLEQHKRILLAFCSSDVNFLWPKGRYQQSCILWMLYGRLQQLEDLISPLTMPLSSIRNVSKIRLVFLVWPWLHFLISASYFFAEKIWIIHLEGTVGSWVVERERQREIPHSLVYSPSVRAELSRGQESEADSASSMWVTVTQLLGPSLATSKGARNWNWEQSQKSNPGTLIWVVGIASSVTCCT